EDRAGPVRGLMSGRRAEALREGRRAPALLLVHRGGQGLHGRRPSRSRLRNGVLGPGHEQLDADLVAASAGGPQARLGCGREGQGRGRKTARERDFVTAAEAFFKDGDKVDHRTRAVAYGKVMEQMAQRYPNDREVMAFYALSLQATADPHDKTYERQKRSAEIAEKIFAAVHGTLGGDHLLIQRYE